MTEEQIKTIQTEIEELCKKHNLWFEVLEKKKPLLKDVQVTIFLKVMK